MSDNIKNMKIILTLQKLTQGLMYGIEVEDDGLHREDIDEEDLIVGAKEVLTHVLNTLAEKLAHPYHGPRMAITFIMMNKQLLALTSEKKLHAFLKNMDELQNEIKKMTEASIDKFKQSSDHLNDEQTK